MSCRRDQGFSVVELLVALCASSVILGGALAFVLVQSRSHRDQTEVQGMQMGVRLALDRILRDARSAAGGFTTGSVVVEDSAHSAITSLNAVSLQNGAGPGGSDVLHLVLADGRGIGSARTAVANSSAPQDIAVSDITGFSAVAPDNYVLVSTGDNAILIPVVEISSGTAPSGTLRLAAMPGHAFPGGLASFPVGSLVLTASVVSYAIDTSLFGAEEPALVLVRGGPLGITNFTEPVATQIEDLQVALGFDGLNGGAADNLISESLAAGANGDEWAYNVSGDTLVGALSTLRMVRVTLVSRTVRPRPGGSDVVAAEDHQPTSGGNTFYRRRLRGVTNVRNLAL